MPKIITVTFSRSIDNSVTVQKSVPEKKMQCSSPKAEAVGGGINVARVLQRFTSSVRLAGSGAATVAPELVN